MESGKMIKKPVRAPMFTQINKFTPVDGSMAKNMDKEHITTKPVENIKENGLKIKNQDMEQCNMPTKTSMRATG